MTKDRTDKSPQLLGLEKAIAEGQLAVRRPVCELIVTYTDDTDDMSEVDRLKSLLRELLPELEKLPEDAMGVGRDEGVVRRYNKNYWIERIREAVGDEKR